MEQRLIYKNGPEKGPQRVSFDERGFTQEEQDNLDAIEGELDSAHNGDMSKLTKEDRQELIVLRAKKEAIDATDFALGGGSDATKKILSAPAIAEEKLKRVSNIEPNLEDPKS